MDGQSAADSATQWAGDANAKLKEMGDKAAASVADAAETARAVADRARAASAEAGTRINQAAQQGSEALQDLSKRGSEWGRYLSETAAAHPIPALLIAAAGGYALARLMPR